MDDERVPILVGAGRLTMRVDVSQRVPSPMDLLCEATDLAAIDLGIDASATAAALADADVYATVNFGPVGMPAFAGGDGKYRNIYPNVPLSLAKRYGANPKPERCFSSMASGHLPQVTVSFIAELIGRGEAHIGVIAGCEYLNLLKQAIKAGYRLAKDEQDSGEKVLRWGDPQETRPQKPGGAAHHKLFTKLNVQEQNHGFNAPVNVYPIYEQALRRAQGLSMEDHMQAVSSVWAGFSEVASEQPEHSWFPRARSSREIQRPGPDNRYVGYPYTKYHCSVIDVDQSAALIVMSVAEAKRRGVPQEKWVYLHGCSETIEMDTLYRQDLHRSRAMEMMGHQCFKDANVTVDQIQQFDVYSCFPSAVEMGTKSLGIKEDVASNARRLTVTGGLAFHGGPGANYVTHSIAAMVQHVRAHPGTFGMVTANGGFLSKHAAGIYSTTPYSTTHPEAKAWSRTDPAEYQTVLDNLPKFPIAEKPHGIGRVETYTVLHNQKGPTQAICIGILQDGIDKGKRFIAVSSNKSVMEQMVSKDFLGLGVLVRSDLDGKGQNTFDLGAASKL